MATLDEVLADIDVRMRKSVDALSRELTSIRTGRANPALVENLAVDYYGVPTPLNQIASISVPEARVIMIQPWDKQALEDVVKGILRSDLGLIPNSDGNAVRINIPTLTQERRRELARLVGKRVEEGHVAARNVRRDGLERLRGMEKDKDLSMDELKRGQDQLQRVTNTYVARMDELRSEKEAEVMEV